MAASFENGNGSGCDGLTHIMAKMWPNHKIATIGHKIFVEKNVKNPHKIEIFHKFHKKIFFLWKLKPLVYIRNSAISTNTQFSKCF